MNRKGIPRMSRQQRVRERCQYCGHDKMLHRNDRYGKACPPRSKLGVI